jgi:Uma2 family endonuclease
VSGFLSGSLFVEIARSQLPYFIPAAGIYQCQQFRGQEKIESLIFPELQLSLAQILAVLQT